MDTKTNLDILFGKIFQYNCDLLHKSNEIKYEYNPIEIIDFYLTSHAMDLVKHLYLSDHYLYSIGFFMNARNYLEGIAFKRYLQSDDFTDLNNKLFQKQFFISEYKAYKDLLDLEGETINKDKIVYDYEKTCEYFQLLLKDKYNKKQINKIIESKYPCMCNPKFNARTLIETYLNEDEIKLYSMFSWYVHPGTNNFYRSSNWEELFVYIINTMFKEYFKLPLGERPLSSWNDLASTNIGVRIQNLLINQVGELVKIADVFRHHYGDNYISDTLIVLGYAINDLAIDNKLSLTEQIKIKFKTILELLSVLYEYGIEFTINKDEYQLLLEHEKVKKLLNNKLEIAEALDSAYLIYKKIFPEGADQEKFNNYFAKTTGYTINVKGETQSLSKLVNNFVDLLNPISINLIKILYEESQLLSHANGYMWFSNKGAFSDTNPIFYTIDDSILIILLKIYKYYDSLREHKYKDIRNIIRNSIKRYDKNRCRINYLLKIKKIDIMS